MVKLPETSKRARIDKTQSTMLAIISIAAVITIFCLMSAKALLSQAAYQRKVVKANQAAVKQLQANVTAAKALVTQYSQVFEGTNPSNIIGGQNTTSPDAVPPNGDNARIVLDALPSKYDFPALISSVSNILTDDKITSPSVTGTDESATIDNNAATNPQPQQIQLTVTGTGTYDNVLAFVQDLERSIRPFDVVSLQLAGPQDSLTFTLTVNTYFQPAKSLNVVTQEVK
ncbi:MAG TPA: hypothetical protein VEH48_00680 [Candidatus Nitrosopolaris sp.]|nr:hypothetical protein [Candidatus Nitrosopolaris sp.]